MRYGATVWYDNQTERVPMFRRPSASSARRRLTALTLGLVAAVAAPTLVDARPTPPSVAGMKILITNDDGVQPGADSVGLFELRAALCDAGADVVVVAPWRNMSGASASITYGSSSTRFTLTTPAIDAAYQDDCATAPSGGGVWGACVTAAGGAGVCDAVTPSLTPADAATLGPIAARDLAGWTAPELVISGTNRGGNDGLNVNVSGTVGAATIASSLGYPSIALSTSSSGDATANARATGTWAVNFVAQLRQRALLPVGYVLAVNYPRVDRGPVTKAEWTTVALSSALATGYVREGASTSYASTYGPCVPGASCGNPAGGTDSASYSAGKIAITPISVDRTLGLPSAIKSISDSLRVAAMVKSGSFNQR